MGSDHPRNDVDDWRDHAACAGLGDTMFPVDTAGVEAAKAICAGCPAVGPCLDFALATNQDHGIWGGQSERKRRRLRQQGIKAGTVVPVQIRNDLPVARKGPAQPRPPKPINHGTGGGYQTHLRRSEDPCDACRAAMRQQQVDLRAAKREAAAAAQAALGPRRGIAS